MSSSTGLERAAVTQVGQERRSAHERVIVEGGTGRRRRPFHRLAQRGSVQQRPREGGREGGQRQKTDVVLGVSIHQQHGVSPSGVFAVVVCLVATVWPAMYAARLRPAEAFREQQ